MKAGIQLLLTVFILLPLAFLAFAFAYAVFGAWAIPLTIIIVAFNVVVIIGRYAQEKGY